MVELDQSLLHLLVFYLIDPFMILLLRTLELSMLLLLNLVT